MKNYDTVTEAAEVLKTRGYTTDFNIAFDKLMYTKKYCVHKS